MNGRCFPLVLITFLCFTLLLLGGEAKSELMIEGTWQGLSLIADGETVPDALVRRSKLVITKHSITLKPSVGLAEVEFGRKGEKPKKSREWVTDPTGFTCSWNLGTGSHKEELDLIYKGNDQTRTLKAIVRVEKGTLMLCVGSQSRPDKFSANQGSGHQLWTFRKLQKEE